MKQESNNREVELTDQERLTLGRQMRAQILDARRVGFALRGSDQVSSQCLVSEMPATPAGEVSCCGAKDFLIDEIREFSDSEGKPISVRCASSAILEMTDAPIHKHASTLEYYIVMSGSGKMILGQGESEQVVPVQEGSVILIPPGQAHGIVSDDPGVPIKALLTFSPGLAPVDQPNYRDEEIIHSRTSQRLSELVRTENN